MMRDGTKPAPKVRVVSYVEHDLKPGDIFESADGDVWIARSTMGASRNALLIWQIADGERVEGSAYEIHDDTIPEPYTLRFRIEENR